MAKAPFGLAVLYLCTLLAAACDETEAQTRLLVWVRADAALAAKLQQVRVAVYANGEPSDGPSRGSARFDIASGKPKTDEQNLPFSFGILAGESSGIELVVRGYATREPNAPLIAEQHIWPSFVLRRTLELSVTLREGGHACDHDAGEDGCEQPDEPMPGTPPVEPGPDPHPDNDAGPLPEPCDKGRGADVCDPVAQCGCISPAHCKVADDRGTCAAAGSHASGALCTRNSECAEGLSCAWGACRSACRAHADCRSDGSKTAECVRRGALNFGFCAEPCAKPGAASCSDGLACSPIKLGNVAENFCLHVEEPCPFTDDGICDESGYGTGFCAADSDTHDCCTRPRPLGECDLITQCGCAKDMACRVVGKVINHADTACGEAGTRPIGSRCDTDAQCVRGADCAGSICKRLCTDTEAGRCPTGTCNLFRFDNQEIDAGSCWQSCEWETQAPCMPGTVCAQLGTGNTCFAQPAACPNDRINNHVCDETTRICAPGTDTSDCMR